jgi:hypothetical protein
VCPALGTLLSPPVVPDDIGLPSRFGMNHVAEIKDTTEQLSPQGRKSPNTG